MKPPRINANRIKINVHVSGLRRLRFRFWLLGWWCVVARLIGARAEVMQCVDIVAQTKGAAEGWKPHPADCFCIDCLPGVDEPEVEA